MSIGRSTGIETCVTRGSVILFSEGAYSSYGLVGSFRAVADFDLAPLTIEYRAEMAASASNPYGFLDWLARRGLIEDFPCREFHLGDYDFSPEWEMRTR